MTSECNSLNGAVGTRSLSDGSLGSTSRGRKKFAALSPHAMRVDKSQRHSNASSACKNIRRSVNITQLSLLTSVKYDSEEEDVSDEDAVDDETWQQVMDKIEHPDMATSFDPKVQSFIESTLKEIEVRSKQAIWGDNKYQDRFWSDGRKSFAVLLRGDSTGSLGSRNAE